MTDTLPDQTLLDRVELDISGMTCAACASRIERKLNKLDGINATVNYATERAVVLGVAPERAPELVKAVEAAGYGEYFGHGLGHGVGLNIHERPSIGHLSKDTLQRGNVISIEPGLYYPERGFGMRIEDLCYVDDSGALVSLTDFHKELVLPLRPA